MKKYVLHPNYITVSADGQQRYVSVRRLAYLYNVDLNECYGIPLQQPYGPYSHLEGVDLSTLTHLYPESFLGPIDWTKEHEEKSPVIKYMLHGGYVISSTDGQEHYVNCQKLAQLYGVNFRECYSVPYYCNPAVYLRGVDLSTVTHLYPDFTGQYKLG